LFSHHLIAEGKAVHHYYDLIANVVHEGKAKSGEGVYKVQLSRSQEQWYQIQDLIVEETLPQMIFLSEAYIQVWDHIYRINRSSYMCA
jgi:U4/U6.U5 tri-snRNP-associated protein 2